MPRIYGTSLNTNESAFPTSYKIDYINLVNHNGDVRDIQNIVTDFSIVESIYVPSIILNLNIKDTVNLLEEFQLSGQEQIDIRVSRRKSFGSTEESKIELTFICTEFPAYGKFNNYTQAYSIKGISRHAYASKFQKISRAFNGSAKEFVTDVLVNDLGYEDYLIYASERDTFSASFIVPNLAPLDAISWALRRSFDQAGSPWYCYETLSGGMAIVPQSELVSKEVWRTFREGKHFNHVPYTAEDYKERQERILSISSNLKLSKYIAGANGGYGSTSEYIDIAKKNRNAVKFDYQKFYEEMILLNDDQNNLNPDFGKDIPGIEQSISKMNQAAINYIPTNSLAFPDGNNYHADTRAARINRAQSYLENLENVTHEIKVAGDFGLAAGKIVELVLTKSIDPNVTVKNSQNPNVSDRSDRALSGKHLVTSVVHNFAEEYYCEMKVKKDSVTVDYY